MINNDDHKNSEIKIIKISSKLFDKIPSIHSLFVKPRRLNFEDKEKFLTASTPLTNTRYERREQLSRIIKLYNQSNVIIFKTILGKN